MKIAVNRCYGGFGLSAKAKERFRELSEKDFDKWADDARTDPTLIKVIEELGEAANGYYAKLEIVEIPDGTDWEIEEYDGKEWVAEKRRTW
jgi:hypothetical protein